MKCPVCQAEGLRSTVQLVKYGMAVRTLEMRYPAWDEDGRRIPDPPRLRGTPSIYQCSNGHQFTDDDAS